MKQRAQRPAGHAATVPNSVHTVHYSKFVFLPISSIASNSYVEELGFCLSELKGLTRCNKS